MSETKRIVFIANPISGTSGKRLILRKVEQLIDQERFTIDIATTQYVGHATEIARSAANRGVDIVCAIGGDGTVNEVARALVHTDTSLAIIPCGSGNGLARHLHIPLDPLRAIKLINEGQARLMDYGIINLHPFFCTCGVGFDAFISQKFAQAGKRGPLTYLENILTSALKYNPETYDLDVEDEHAQHASYKAMIIACANASQYGNNVYIAPQASVRDGLMDVTIIEPFTPLEAPQIAFGLLSGNLDNCPCVRTFKCKGLHIHRSKPGVIHYDGDPIASGEQVDVSIISKGLTCICPGDEGTWGVGESIQNTIADYFSDMYLRSEELIENSALKAGRIFKLGDDITRRLSRSREHK